MLNMDNFDFQGKKVLVRVDFNVPLDSEFNILDDTRIQGAAPTIKKILSGGGAAIVMSHLGRPKNGPEGKFSLEHLMPKLRSLYGSDNVHFSSDCIGENACNLSASLQPGHILLLENLRFYKEEEKGDRDFAEKLSHHGTVYINDAFGTAHRAHASTAIIADFFDAAHKGFGYLMQSEIKNAEWVLHQSEKPVTAIVGGAKVSDKIQLLDRLVEVMDNILIGGGMAYTFISAQGGKIGKSLCEPDFLDLALKILHKAKIHDTKIFLPPDSVIADAFSADAKTDVVPSHEIPDGWMGLDIGKESIKQYQDVVLSSKTILWNGPMGVFEFESFAKGTFSMAQAVANATKHGAFSLIGGGDSVSAIQQSGLADQVSYISTGGGAMLEFLEGKELPGIKAIRS